MKARTKFAKLEYNFYEDNEILYYSKDFGYGISYVITFVKDHKCIEITPFYNDKPHYFVRLDKETIEAINTQIKELKW